MTAPYLSYALLVTIPLPRILMHLRRNPGPGLKALAAALVYLVVLLLPLKIESHTGLLIVLSAAVPIYHILLIRLIRNQHLAASLLLLLNLVTIPAVFGRPDLVSGFSDFLLSRLDHLAAVNLVVAAVSPGEIESFLFYGMGIMLVSVGLNDPIALFLKRSHLMPGFAGDSSSSDPAPADPEPARGRVIGYLERAIILVLMLSGNIAAIGFVLAAKGITRFRQLDDRDFAEYVLIGTLLSVGATMLAGVVLSAFV
ncbi:hypothetical protein [Marispirochaeta aestuarii]|uniref:hypothetical protein n=1 Tax=Marispirochaeta aestuarii TaxID=1963862 RepID=UPI0029C7E27D|nr:hypothetical protein [Marispirochaeta aestuarii]